MIHKECQQKVEIDLEVRLVDTKEAPVVHQNIQWHQWIQRTYFLQVITEDKQCKKQLVKRKK